MEQIDFKLVNGDIVFEENNIALASGMDIQVQALRQILSTRLGEYFLNTEEGLDFEVFLGKKEIDEDEMMEALQSAAEQVDGFIEFTQITYEYNEEKRNLKFWLVALFADETSEEIEMEVNM